MKRTLFILVVALLTCTGNAQLTRPHLLVTDQDKPAVQGKIHEQAWAKSIADRISSDVASYVERHVTDPDWILSRYQMNRVPGRRYTRVISDAGGLKVLRYEGDAPFPTVRVGSHIRVPVTESGASYLRPSIEELVPNDTSRLMYLFNTETKKKEWIDPQAFTGDINGSINDLAMDASIMYWLNDDEKYAKFAADILDQWARGAYYMEPIIGPCRTGFLNMQTLGDAESRPLIIAYDFLHDYMQRKGYELKYYEPVFEKIASTLAFRGFWNNNWYAAESSTFVFASLSLENAAKKDYYLQYFLTKDTIKGACGTLALPSTVEKWLTPDGHWKEPGGYHNFPVGNLLIASLALEKNGYDIFRKFPALFKASYAMLKYSFPNLTVSAFGDTGRASQSAESLEVGLIAAIKYSQPELPEMLASMRKLIEGGKYRRESSGFLGLLCYVPDLPSVQSSYSWPRGGTLDFARYFLQRNSMDPMYGLMFGVQGATYNHNHNNGMAMELYGMGTVMGIDAGTGPTYEHPLHQTYYSQWAAHNTVVAAGSSGSVPWSGGAGTKNIGQIELASMEPMPDKAAVSPSFSFTDTRYFDKSTNTNQSRTMAIIRTSEKAGYYVDIYRSDNAERNDYVYHNIGDALVLSNAKREELPVKAAQYPVVGKDYPGFRHFSNVRKAEGWNENLIALFSGKNEESKPVFMQVLVAGKPGRTYFTANSLHTKTSGRQYASSDPPVFTMVDNGESASKPFIAVFEPFGESKDGYTVDRIAVEQRADSKEFTLLTVYGRSQSRQMIFQSVDAKKTYTSGKDSFAGSFGVIDFSGEVLRSIYLGEGEEISHEGYSLKPQSRGSASIELNGKELKVSCNQATEIGLPAKVVKKAAFTDGGKTTALKVTKNKGVAVFTVPAVLNGIVRLQ